MLWIVITRPVEYHFRSVKWWANVWLDGDMWYWEVFSVSEVTHQPESNVHHGRGKAGFANEAQEQAETWIKQQEKAGTA